MSKETVETRMIVETREAGLILTAKQQETLRFLHQKVKGTYMQLTALLDELDLLRRT